MCQEGRRDEKEAEERDLLSWFQSLPVYWIYVTLGFSAWLENIFPPIPGDTITAIGAFFVATGRLSFWGVFRSTTIGSLTGFMTLFLLAKYFGREYFLKKNFKIFPKEALIKAENRFKVHGYVVVLLNRFLPGIRSVISITAGLLKLKMIYVLFFCLVSAATWNSIWIYSGYLLGSNYETVKSGLSKLMRNYNIISGTLLAAAIITWLIIRRKKGR
jgi:membrane protein DedA with SNARE-associated domain